MNIYVGNLPYDITENELREMFARFGEVASTNLVTDHFHKRPKGFGFVEMPDNSEADAAIKALNKTRLRDRVLKVNQVEKKKGKGRGSRRR